VSTQPLDWRRIAWRGAAAGLTGGLFFGVFVFPAVRAEVSSGLIALYAAACLAWGIGYSYLAETRAQLNTLPIVSGIVYGLVVYVVMQLVLYTVAAERMASALEVAYGGFATCLFFGLPIALVTRLLSSRR
jgi:ACR3 family arsenite efflux pump ArsB